MGLTVVYLVSVQCLAHNRHLTNTGLTVLYIQPLKIIPGQQCSNARKITESNKGAHLRSHFNRMLVRNPLVLKKSSKSNKSVRKNIYNPIGNEERL